MDERMDNEWYAFAYLLTSSRKLSANPGNTAVDYLSVLIFKNDVVTPYDVDVAMLCIQKLYSSINEAHYCNVRQRCI